MQSTAYPAHPSERYKWIVAQRPERNKRDPFVPVGAFAERERAADGRLVSTATILLTNRECPWKCVMCDLWKDTLLETVPVGAIPTQIRTALWKLGFGDRGRLARTGRRLDGQIEHIKLYNSGSFFDAQAIPPEDHDAIAELLAPFSRVIVECHPRLIDDRVVAFARKLKGQFEIAMGLETVHPAALTKLNKGMDPEDFAQASKFLRSNGIGVRAFILVNPPFVPQDEAATWVERTIDFAFDSRADVCSLIPTRASNGAMEQLASGGNFIPPTLDDLEAALEYGIRLQRGRIFVDLWELHHLPHCDECFEPRRARIEEMNFTQQVLPPVTCKRKHL